MLNEEQIKVAKEMLKSEVKAYFDVRDELGLSEEQYYELIRLDVNEWRIRARGKHLSKPHWVKKSVVNRFLETKDRTDWDYPLLEIAKEYRLTQRHVVNYVRGENHAVNVKKRPFIKPTNNKELEQRICKLYDLGLGQSLILIELEYHYINVKSVADTLKKYSRHSTVQDAKELHINSRVFEFIDTEEKAYWLGMLYADGWITARGSKKEGKQIGLSLEKKDKNHIENFRSFLGADSYKIAEKTHKKKDGSDAKAYQLVLSSKNLYNSLSNLGMTHNKSTDANPPQGKIPKHLRKHFWRGALDGDGSIHYGQSGNLKIGFVGTPDFVYQFLGYLFHNDLIKEYKTVHKHRNSHYGESKHVYFSIALREEVYDIIKHLYDDCVVSLERKHRFLHVVEQWEEVSYAS